MPQNNKKKVPLDYSIESRIYTLNQLHKIIKKKAIEVVDKQHIDKLIPHFKDFAYHLVKDDYTTLYSISEGISAIRSCLISHKISNGVTFCKKIKESFIPKKEEGYGINRLLRELKNIELDFSLGNKPFPDFKMFRSAFVGSDKTKFTIDEGVAILKAYSKGRIYDFQVALKYALRTKKAQKQDGLMAKKDEIGRIGIQHAPAIISKNETQKKQQRISKPLWVEKK
jgi:hypothetical protein